MYNQAAPPHFRGEETHTQMQIYTLAPYANTAGDVNLDRVYPSAYKKK